MGPVDKVVNWGDIPCSGKDITLADSCVWHQEVIGVNTDHTAALALSSSVENLVDFGLSTLTLFGCAKVDDLQLGEFSTFVIWRWRVFQHSWAHYAKCLPHLE